MKTGDLVTLRSGLVSVSFMSDELEKVVDDNQWKESEELMCSIRSFRRGNTATVLGVNPENTARVKLLFESGSWWANVSDLIVLK